MIRRGKLLQVGAFDRAGVGHGGPTSARGRGSVQDEDFGSAFFESEDGGAGRASGASTRILPRPEEW